ncbi:MAG: hypothetical protein ACM3PT_13715 [Deltaproteobacteria bacterium]
MKFSKLLLFLFFIAAFSCSQDDKRNNQIEKHYVLAKDVSLEVMIKKVPKLAEYAALIEGILDKKPPVLMLEDSELPDENHRRAQSIAISDQEFLRDVYHKQTGEALRNEIMSVRQANADELQGVQCSAGNCFRVLMYNYYGNNSTIAFVDVAQNKVINIKRVIDAEAEINRRLHDLAIEIALNSEEVLNALKIDGKELSATRSDLEISMNKTKCERSKHLCVGPSFYNRKNNRMVWSIVDMTDWKLRGLAWAEKKINDHKITEMELQNEFVMAHFCEKNNDTILGDWKINFRIVGSDGLEVFDVLYKDRKVINSSKIVDWHVSYLNKQNVGYSDATGCPMFSAAAVVAFSGPYVEKIEDGKSKGFAFVQDFRSPIWPAMCNYRYQSRFEFYDDGCFRIMGVNNGKGCNDSAVYKPVFRIDLEIGEGGDNVAQWNGNTWQNWTKEQWSDQNSGKFTNEGYWFKITDNKGNGYYLEPDRGQFGKMGRGDAAFVYVSKLKSDVDEGVTDMVTIGDCCSYTYKQGPEKFLEPAEDLSGQKIILWYAPRMYNDKRPGKEYCWANMVPDKGKLNVKTWPGSVGPKFIPVKINN